jgi:hypothetical protein
MSAGEFAACAREQIRAADTLLAQHRPANGSYCQCGRPVPCSQAETVQGGHPSGAPPGAHS